MARYNAENPRLSQSYYKIKKRVPLSKLLHLGNWEFKLYALFLEKADENKIPDGEWIWKPSNLHELIGISSATFYKAISILKAEKLIDAGNRILLYGAEDGSLEVRGTNDGKVEVEPKVKKEREEEAVRNRLKNKLGGASEVAIPTGRVDLLTDSEIIEVKKFDDWKSALGQVLAYSGFFPKHQKRIHLFGTAQQLENLADVEAACLSFGVVVTGEVI